jgi:ribonuclease Z
MEKITLTFLGTGNAIPTEQRNHSGILLNYKDESILIDCGEGIQRQFRIAKISPTKLTRMLITHWHGDHILGIPGLFQTLAMSEYNKTLKFYGPQKSKHYLSLIKELMIHLNINLEEYEVEGKFIDTSEFYIEAAKMSHGISTNAYSFVIKDKLRLDRNKIKKLKIPNSPLLGKLANGEDIVLNGKKIRSKDITYLEKGRKITFILDTVYNEEAVKLAKDSDLIIAECTFSNEEKEQAKEKLHLTTKDAATIAKKAKAKALILTHVSQRYEHNLKMIQDEARKVFKNSKVVNDFDVIEL